MRTFVRWAAWWVVLALLWLLYQGEYNRIEQIAAACAAAIAATVGVAVRRQERAGLRLEFGWAVRALFGQPSAKGVYVIKVDKSAAGGQKAVGGVYLSPAAKAYQESSSS